VANAGLEGLGSFIDVDSEIGFSQWVRNGLRVATMAFRDGIDPCLNWCKPDRKPSAAMLDQDAEEPFERAEQGSVHDERPVLFPVRTNVARTEPFR
jgi:hypothetical protein